MAQAELLLGAEGGGAGVSSFLTHAPRLSLCREDPAPLSCWRCWVSAGEGAERRPPRQESGAGTAPQDTTLRSPRQA